MDILRTLMLLLLAAGASAAGAIGDPVGADDPGLRTVTDLRSRFGGDAVPPGLSSRGEVALAASELALDAATKQPGAAWKAADYDSLYSLLQNYRDELRAMGFKQSQLEDELASLKVRAFELKQRLDKLQPKDGMKINGRAQQLYDDLLLSGPGRNSGNTFRYRHGLARAQLDLNVTRGIFSGQLRYFSQRIFGNFYDPCSTCRAGVESIFIQIRTPIAVEAGDMDLMLSPLTVWRNEDAQPFEPEIFRLRRQDLRDQLSLSPNALRLRGVRLSTDLVLLESQRLKLNAGIYPLGNAGNTVYVNGTVPLLDGSAPAGEAMTLPYNTYFGAWRSSLPFSWGQLAYNGTQIKDAPDTATVTHASGPLAGQRVKGFESHVHSAQLQVQPSGSGFKGSAEYAQSVVIAPNFSPSGADLLTGTAIALNLEYRRGGFGLALGLRDVSEAFTSAAAQGRSWDASFQALGPFPTENSLYNPDSSAFNSGYGGIGAPEPPEAHLNARLIAPQVLVNGAYRLNQRIAYDPAVNAVSPYGPATPNRSGVSGDLDLALFSEGLKLMGGADMAVERQVPSGVKAVSFMQARGGMALDLEPWLSWPLKLNGGYTMGDLRDGDKVAFSSVLVDLGVEWRPWKELALHGGARHLDYNGTLRYGGSDPVLAAFGYNAVQQVYDIGALGLRWQLAEGIVFRTNYTTILYDDLLQRAAGKAAWWAADQTYMQIDIVF